MTETERKEILKATLHKYGLEAQLDVAIEELSELMKAIIKYKRLGYRFDVIENLCEETADVQIMLDQLRMFLNFETAEIEEEKLYRLSRRINKMKDGNK